MEEQQHGNAMTSCSLPERVPLVSLARGVNCGAFYAPLPCCWGGGIAHESLFEDVLLNERRDWFGRVPAAARGGIAEGGE